MNETTFSVGFDGLFLDQTATGVGMYASNLWRIFDSGEEATGSVHLLVPDVPTHAAFSGQNVTRYSPPSVLKSGKAHKLWWEQWGMVQAAAASGVDFVHIPHFAAPVRAGRPFIVTIHDVIPFVLPAYRASASMRLYLRLISRAARSASAIITDSECSRRDIERHLGIDRGRISVIPLAVDEQFRPVHDAEADAALRERYQLPGPVIFNVGGLDARKNVDALVRAFAASLPDLDADTRLVIAGSAHTGNARLYPPLDPVITEHGLQDRVVLTGRISEADKLRLYNLADLYVFTSLYEGFGLSPLEAMACGTPVICSNRSSLPEVVGEGGILVDPTPQKLAGAISTVMNDGYLRRRLSAGGLEQASKFSWNETAAMTFDVYRQVHAGQHGSATTS
jgi:glycosyltransferase involved in cell wall biosynthesis